MALPLPHQQNTQATNVLQALTYDQVFDEQHDRIDLLIQSLQLLIYSYPDIYADNGRNPLFQDRINEYVQTVTDLYGVPLHSQQEVDGALTDALDECRQKNIYIFITTRKLIGAGNAQEVELICSNTLLQTNDNMVLDLTSVDQIGINCYLMFNFDEFVQLKRENHSINVTMEGIGWSPNEANEEVHDLEVDINQLNGEGLQLEHDFGRGVRVVIEITYEVDTQQDQTPDEKNFHMYTLYHMLNKRADHYAQGVDVDWSHHKERTVGINYNRPTSLLNTYQLFWRSVDPQTTNSVNYFDLQKGYEYGVDIEERVCLCNEWCNWNAFFAYNPIYRFIIVQNSALRLYYKFNVPDLYVFTCVMTIHIRRIIQMLPKAGLVLPLLRSAETYRNIMYFENIRSNPINSPRYDASSPDVNNVIGIAYVYLRYGLNVVRLIHELTPDPRSMICVKNLVGYLSVLDNLHVRITYCNTNYVNDKNVWLKELEPTSFQLLGFFFSTTYQSINSRVLQQQTVNCLLESDVEYEKFIPKNNIETQIEDQRRRAVAKKPENEAFNPEVHNPLNIGFTIRTFTETFIWCYQFFAKIEPMFPIARKGIATRNVWQYCQDLDHNLRQMWTLLPPDEKNTLFEINMGQQMDHLMPLIGAMSDQISSLMPYVYTLKLYSFGFVIQRHCIKARNKHLSSYPENRQFSDVLNFIADYQVIEQTLRASIGVNSPLNHLFNLDIQRLNHLFVNFYGMVGLFGKPDHQNYTQQTHQFIAFIDAAHRQYQKTWVWMREDGINRIRFTEIIQHFVNQLDLILEQSNLIRDVVIAPAIGYIRNLQFPYEIETMDVMVLYLMRATCYCFISMVFALFNQLHTEVESQALSQLQRTYSMGRPGWVQFFATIDNVIDNLDDHRTSFIIFDDELERIDQTFEDTERMIRNIYKRYYYRLTDRWIHEIGSIVRYIQTQQQPPLTNQQLITALNVVAYQLMFGLSFSARFHSTFRYTFWSMRKELNRIWGRFVGQQNFMVGIRALLTFATLYLANQNDIQLAQPPHCQNFQNLAQQFPTNINALTPQQVGLMDMNLFDVPLV